MLSILNQYKIPLLLIIGYYITANYFFNYFCPSMVLFGLPCPACGITRAFILALQGRFHESFIMHPLLGPVIVLSIVYGYLKLKHPHQLQKLYIPLLLTILTSFVLLGLRLYYTLGAEPIVINENAIFFQFIYYILKQ